jgi:alkanesulfonate monooxygenase SsuD/methylene tetrahydromethanopterin reductase-like flavin-dependent oxidoreductase (luciferase family)
MNDLEFGFQLVPTTDLGLHRELVAAAEEGGLDLCGVQDHPYAPPLVDALSLIAMLMATTQRLRFFPDVVNLPLRHPAMLAKTAASLDLLSGGRFELGIGAGGAWDAIEGMGIPRRDRAQALAALAEAVRLMRRVWQRDGAVSLDGEYYPVRGIRPGPGPAHPIGIWVGSIRRRMLEFTGREADGWAAPIVSYLPYEKWPEANTIIDGAARDAGRDPSAVRRIAQLTGTITDTPEDADARSGAAPVRGTPDQWATLIARLATEQPFRTFIIWLEHQDLRQIELFAREVVPAARDLLGRSAGRAAS